MIKKYILPFLLLVTLFSCPVLGQVPGVYSEQWKKIDQLEKKGLTQSAQKESRDLFLLARKEKNNAEEIKALIYIMKYRNLVEEDALFTNYQYTDSLAAESPAPVRNILRSIQADLCIQFYQQNRYQIFNRTNLQVEKNSDIRTWSMEKLINTASQLYDQSLQNSVLLQKTPLSQWEPILAQGNTRNLRPTLFDFLAHRALEFLMNEESSVIHPSDRYMINDARAFSPAATFSTVPFQTSDSNSTSFKALLLMQKILAFHLRDKEPDALFDADLIRIAFVNRKGQFDKKEALYEESLKALESRLAGHPLGAEAMYLRASLYAEKGRRYQPESNTSNQFDLVRAADLCQKAIAEFPESRGGLHAKNLLRELQKPSLEIKTEKVNVPGQAFRSLLKYKNLDQIWLKLIRIDRKTLQNFIRKNNEEQWSELNKMKEERKWQVTLPNLKDLQEHSLEFSQDGLSTGTYLLIASRDERFGLRENIMCRQVLYISNISYLISNEEDVLVVHRETGRPLAGAKVICWESKYDYQSGRTQEKIIRELITDPSGKVKWNRENDYRSYLVQVRWENDELFTDESVYGSYYYREKTDAVLETQTYFFTDRSIYRPGQTVYFKGIMLELGADKHSNRIITNRNTMIWLEDENETVVDSLNVTTNENGSFSGTFKLPTNGLTGMFYIRDTSNNRRESFRVEEYKRPKFSVGFDVPTGSYQLHDSIRMVGHAKAYAGNGIGGARVSYRVVRRASYPDWFTYRNVYLSKSWFPQGRNETEICNGITTTLPDGSFIIAYKAVPDETSDKKWQPVFHFDVMADVTDINGETRSGSQTVSVSYQAIQLEISSDIKLSPDSISAVRIYSRNINGLFYPSTVTVKAIPMISPGRYIRPRLWEKPDLHIISKEAFIQAFPHDPYENEDQPSFWQEGEALWSVTDSTLENGRFSFPKQKLTDGWYKIIAITADKQGETVRAEQLIRISTGQPLITDALLFDVNNRRPNPGDKIKYTLKSVDEMYLLHAIVRPDKNISQQNILVNSKQPFTREITITEADRGDIYLSYICVRYNRVMEGLLPVNVTWNNKDLQISLDTYREKLLPGSQETWSISITGKQAEKKASELLVNMYDQSLDQFYVHNWTKLSGIWPFNRYSVQWTSYNFNSTGSIPFFGFRYEPLAEKNKVYDALILAEQYRLYKSLQGKVAGLQSVVVTAYGVTRQAESSLSMGDADMKDDKEKESQGNETTGGYAKHMKLPKPGLPPAEPEGDVQIRKNLQETAFFYPNLRTDSSGTVRFSFTMPEALTQWKFMAMAHDKNLASGYFETSVITQKPLMVQPNAPRFVRESDRISLPVKIVNLSDKEISGTVQLELLDAATNKPVDGWFKNVFPVQHMSVEAGQSMSIEFPIEIPASYASALTWRVKAISNDKLFSDGEESSIPVLSNRMLVTETMPISLRHRTSGEFKLEKLIKNESPTRVNHSLTVEYTSNPAWLAVQSLPYLMEFPHECAEQQFNRYFANTLAASVISRYPRIKQVFDTWKNKDSAALLSNLEKNQELKTALLLETPWVMEAKNESTQKKQIALLFDLNRLAEQRQKTWKQFSDIQTSNGGFSWFSNGPDNRYITQYIVSGFGHLMKLGALTREDISMAEPVLGKTLAYLDNRIADDYRQLVRRKARLKANNLSQEIIQYLYMRSFFPDKPIPAQTVKAYQYYMGQAKKYWLGTEKNIQAMIAVTLYRKGDVKSAKNILRSLEENAIDHAERGMYWKDLSMSGYFRNQAPVENQALMIEAFSEIDKNPATIDNLKTWLLRQKQTRHWGTTKATAEACYALLLSGSDWLASEKNVRISLGNQIVSSQDQPTEAGTGYLKKTFHADAITTEMGQIRVQVSSAKSDSSSSSWGAVYWQYFENLDEISSSASNPLTIEKKIFIQENSPAGPVLKEYKQGETLHKGDKVIARIILRADRDMEFIHLKDMRGACMEPVNVLSGYKWQDGLGYYESTRDAASHFFFDFIPRGTYVFEYPMFVSHTGTFSGGISSIQCMYAPEFSSHSEGLSVEVAE